MSVRTLLSDDINGTCVVWLSRLHCSEGANFAWFIHMCIVFPASFLFYVLLIVSISRRYILLTERPHGFIIVSSQLLAWFPFWLVYYILYFLEVDNNYLMSLFNWLGYTVIGTSIPQTVLTWIDLSSDKMKYDKSNVVTRYPKLYIAAISIFVLSTVAAATTGYSYSISTRLITSAWSTFLVVCIIVLIVTGVMIKRKINTSMRKAVRFAEVGMAADDEDSDLDYANFSINRILFLVFGVLSPALVFLSMYAIFLKEIDDSIIWTQIIQGAFRLCSFGFIAFWSIVFWTETTHKINSRTPTPRSSLGTTTPSSETSTPSSEPSPRDFSSKELSPRELSPRELSPRELSPRELSPRELSPRELSPRKLSSCEDTV